MKKNGLMGGFMAAVIIVVGLFTVIGCIEKIPTGYVGVVYKMSGGVQDEILTQGWHIVSPTKKVKEFTVGNEQIVMTKDERDGSKGDDSFAVATADNANIDISFQMLYRYDAETVVDTFKDYKGMSGEDIVNNRVRTLLKSKISEVTTDYTMMDIYSGDRTTINQEITDYLNEEFHRQLGINVLDASIVDVHPSEQLQDTINKRVDAIQKKQEAEANQERIKVEKETELIQAEADAKIAEAKAQAEARVIEIEAQAEAEANRLIAQSITPELIAMKEAEARMEHGWVEIQGANSVVVK